MRANTWSVLAMIPSPCFLREGSPISHRQDCGLYSLCWLWPQGDEPEDWGDLQGGSTNHEISDVKNGEVHGGVNFEERLCKSSKASRLGPSAMLDLDSTRSI